MNPPTTRPPPIPLIKTVHTAETLALALARQQRYVERHAERLRMAKASLPAPAPKVGLMLESGMQLRSPSGRALSPVPRIDATTNGTTRFTQARIDQWLHHEATEEALVLRQDAELKLTLLAGMDPRRLTDSDRTFLNWYLGFS